VGVIPWRERKSFEWSVSEITAHASLLQHSLT
jgi:hypothetical protein